MYLLCLFDCTYILSELMFVYYSSLWLIFLAIIMFLMGLCQFARQMNIQKQSTFSLTQSYNNTIIFIIILQILSNVFLKLNRLNADTREHTFSTTACSIYNFIHNSDATMDTLTSAVPFVNSLWKCTGTVSGRAKAPRDIVCSANVI